MKRGNKYFKGIIFVYISKLEFSHVIMKNKFELILLKNNLEIILSMFR